MQLVTRQAGIMCRLDRRRVSSAGHVVGRAARQGERSLCSVEMRFSRHAEGHKLEMRNVGSFQQI